MFALIGDAAWRTGLDDGSFKRFKEHFSSRPTFTVTLPFRRVTVHTRSVSTLTLPYLPPGWSLTKLRS